MNTTPPNAALLAAIASNVTAALKPKVLRFALFRLASRWVRESEKDGSDTSATYEYVNGSAYNPASRDEADHSLGDIKVNLTAFKSADYDGVKAGGYVEVYVLLPVSAPDGSNPDPFRKEWVSVLFVHDNSRTHGLDHSVHIPVLGVTAEWVPAVHAEDLMDTAADLRLITLAA